MRERLRVRLGVLGLAAALLAAALALALLLARAQASPVPGGTVPSTLELSLGEPGSLKRSGSTPEGTVYTSTLRAEVTATDAPAQLSLTGASPTSPVESLRSWSEPVSRGVAKLRLREVVPSKGSPRNNHQLFLVTLTAGGP